MIDGRVGYGVWWSGGTKRCSRWWSTRIFEGRIIAQMLGEVAFYAAAREDLRPRIASEATRTSFRTGLHPRFAASLVAKRATMEFVVHQAGDEMNSSSRDDRDGEAIRIGTALPRG